MKLLSKYQLKEKIIILSGTASFILLIIISINQSGHNKSLSASQLKAAGFMELMLETVAEYCETHNISIDIALDPSKSGLIGPEWTEMTSTIGHLEAKRTTLQPDFAALIVELLEDAGAKKNDTIAFACSGSFPGLLLAVHSAVNAMGLHCKTIISLGSSSYGANRIDFNLLDIYDLLYRNEHINKRPLAVSLGGEQDQGEDWDESTRRYLEEQIISSGVHFLGQADLQDNIAEREQLLNLSGNGNIKVLVNAGGAMANIGTSQSILKLKPGLAREIIIPDTNQQGLIHRAAINNIPVIHLLNIKGLAVKHGIKWDPVIR